MGKEGSARDNSGQLDLFNDGEPALLARGLAAALCRHDIAEAETLLRRLGEVGWRSPHFGDLETLVQETPALGSGGDPDGGLERLERRLVPAARALGGRAPEYLSGAWRRVAGALAEGAFDVGNPRRHASYAALRAEDWPAVRQAVERECGWRYEPILLERRLRAAHGLGEDRLAVELMSLLCWEFPGSAAALLPGDPRFGAWFQEFRQLPDSLRPSAFPAWYALSLSRRLPISEDAGDSPGRRLAAAVNAVLAEAPGEPDMAARRRLQQADAGLFRMFMARREVRDGM